MSRYTIPDIEARSGIQKQPGETPTEYLRRVGRRTDLPQEDVETVINQITLQQFGPDSTPSNAHDPSIEEFLQAVETITKDVETTGSKTESHSGLGAQHRDTAASEPSPATVSSNTARGENPEDDTTSSVRYVWLLIGIGLVISGVAISGGEIPSSDDVPISDGDVIGLTGDDEDDGTEEDESEGDTMETDVVDSAAEAEGTLEVTDMVVDSAAGPEEEFIELTNVGTAAIDMSDWTVRDRENDGAVDARGLDPVTFPDGFVLEEGESVRIVSAPGEDTGDTVHWGYDTRNWHEDGDVIIVLDDDGDEVLREEYGTLPEENGSEEEDDLDDEVDEEGAEPDADVETEAPDDEENEIGDSEEETNETENNETADNEEIDYPEEGDN
jgi:hypothetical protein